MLKFFKHNYIAQLVVIVLLLVVLWVPVFIAHVDDIAVGTPTTPLYNIFVGLFSRSSLTMTIFTFVVFGASVFFFNSMLSVNQLVSRNSSIGAFVYVLCMCCVPLQEVYYPFLLACPFIMMAMQTIYLIYQVEKPEIYLMNTGLFLALASMFYFPSIILIIWALISMMVMDIKGFRYYVIPITSFLIPYFLLFAYYYFDRTLIESYNDYILTINDLSLVKLRVSISEMSLLVLDLILLSLSFMMLKSGNADNSVSTRKKVNVTLLLLIFSFSMLFIQRPVMYNGLMFMVIAVFISMALCYLKKKKIVDILIVVMMVAIIVNQYLPLFGIKI